jgi:hypothetical protein
MLDQNWSFRNEVVLIGSLLPETSDSTYTDPVAISYSLQPLNFPETWPGVGGVVIFTIGRLRSKPFPLWVNTPSHALNTADVSGLPCYFRQSIGVRPGCVDVNVRWQAIAHIIEVIEYFPSSTAECNTPLAFTSK